MGRSRARIRAICWSLALALIIPGIGEAGDGSVPASRASEGPRLLLDLAFFDNVGFSERMKGLVLREVEESFLPLGVEIGWVDRLREPGRRARTHEIRVLVVDVSPLSWGFDARVMGTVLGPRRGAIGVFYPAVLRTLRRYRPFRLPGHGGIGLGKDSAHVARALARVIVHELVHTLTPGLGHSERGIMQRDLDSADLVERPLQLDSEFSAALQRNLRVAIAEARDIPVEEVEPRRGPGK